MLRRLQGALGGEVVDSVVEDAGGAHDVALDVRGIGGRVPHVEGALNAGEGGEELDGAAHVAGDVANA